MNTYATLKTSIASWLAQDDLTAYIDDFIDIAEARVNRILRIRAMETTANVTLTASSASAALPADYLEMRRIYLDGSPQYLLSFSTPEQIGMVANDSGRPKFYTIRGDYMDFPGPADSAYVAKLHYYAKFTALSDSNTSTWLTTNYPQVLLYGALRAAAEFIHDDAQMEKWGALFDRAIDELKNDDKNAKFGPSPAMRSVGSRP